MGKQDSFVTVLRPDLLLKDTSEYVDAVLSNWTDEVSKRRPNQQVFNLSQKHPGLI